MPVRRLNFGKAERMGGISGVSASTAANDPVSRAANASPASATTGGGAPAGGGGSAGGAGSSPGDDTTSTVTNANGCVTTTVTSSQGVVVSASTTGASSSQAKGAGGPDSAGLLDVDAGTVADRAIFRRRGSHQRAETSCAWQSRLPPARQARPAASAERRAQRGWWM